MPVLLRPSQSTRITLSGLVQERPCTAIAPAASATMVDCGRALSHFRRPDRLWQRQPTVWGTSTSPASLARSVLSINLRVQLPPHPQSPRFRSLLLLERVPCAQCLT